MVISLSWDSRRNWSSVGSGRAAHVPVDVPSHLNVVGLGYGMTMRA